MRNPSLSTLAELSNFKQTGRLTEVDALCREFAVTWPEAVRSFEYGRSSEGRSMRVLLASRSGALTAVELRARKIPVLMIQAGIHPGESDGKDAGFIALRELLEGSAAKLDDIALLFVPAFNADGHERVGRWGRPNQNGPEETGWRTTGQNLNLNRDYMKADTPEMRAMLHLIDEWDPLICADLHVTDGADFEPDVSIQGEPINQGDENLRASGREIRDAVIARLAELGSLPLDFYPDLSVTDDPSSGFALTVYSPRFSIGYFPQRNRFTLLVETHSWKDYATRVSIMRNTVLSLCELVGRHGSRWLDLVQQADAVATTLSGSEVVLDYASPWREPAEAGGATVARGDDGARLIDFRGYTYTRKPSAISGDLVTVYDPATPQIWRVPLRDAVTPSFVVTAPAGFYVVPVPFAPDIADRLDAHGIEFEWLASARPSVPAQTFRADTVTFSPAPFEGRMRAAVRGAWADDPVSLLAGSLVVPVAQKLSRLVLALFEPQAPDSFAAWGFFNACFEQKEQMEPYVAEQIAQSMLDRDALLAEEFKRRLAEDAGFAASPSRRLEFFLRRHVSWDSRYNLYPVMRVASLSQ
jgi:zinc carboxypeptidase